MSETTRSLIAELYAYNDWANGRVLQLCEGLEDAQLDAPREMGFGSLRATLFHILAAEQIWLGRWLGHPWQPLATDPQGITIEQLAAALRETSERRAALIVEEEPVQFERMVEYGDSHGNRFSHRIGDLLLHVANHGIHHRAQALHYLKHFGRTVPAGLDYLFYKLARPDLGQRSETVDALRGFGLEVAAAPGQEVRFEAAPMQRYFHYGDWAFETVLAACEPLSDDALDQPFDMGIGTIRRNLLHLYDAEHWWLRNWTEGPREFERLPETTPLAELRSLWTRMADRRNQFLESLSGEDARRIVTVRVGPTPPMDFRIVESCVQLCGHGTHHRAQAVNMLRRSGVKPPAIDLIGWVRSLPPG